MTWRAQLHVRKGDEVVVTAGNERGKRGKVLRVDAKKRRVLVEGVNQHVKHLRKSPQNPQGGRVEREFPVAAASVLLWSEKAQKGVRTRFQVLDGRKVRVGIPCGTRFD
ncbi:MAG: 50S ribosomal protein L24 [Planctomycetota bacterium]|nr:MAG: 50S ribosomal protein L24 [Planctomycetota bacterium]